jgi:hypothetical protein
MYQGLEKCLEPLVPVLILMPPYLSIQVVRHPVQSCLVVV